MNQQLSYLKEFKLFCEVFNNDTYLKNFNNSFPKVFFRFNKGSELKFFKDYILDEITNYVICEPTEKVNINEIIFVLENIK